MLDMELKLGHVPVVSVCQVPIAAQQYPFIMFAGLSGENFR